MRQHFNARIYRAFCRYIEIHHPDVDIQKLCRDAGLSYDYLSKEDNWVSISFARKFTLLCIERTGDSKISFHAGRQNMSPESIGDIIFLFISKNLKIRRIYKNLPGLTQLFSKLTRVTCVEDRDSLVRIEISARPEVLETDEEREILRAHLKDIYENTLGYYMAIPNLHHLPRATAQADWIDEDGSWPKIQIELSFIERSSLSWGALLALGAVSFCGWIPGALDPDRFWLWALTGLLVSMIGYLAFKTSSLKENLQEGARALDLQTENYSYVQREREAASRFVPWQFVSLLGHKDLAETKLQDLVETEMTVMFCDLKNFSPLAESIGPTAVHQYLNRYFAIVGQVLRKFNGQEVQFAGDEVLAVFPEHSAQALMAAAAIQRALEQESKILAQQNQPPMEATIGINSGKMTLGAIGYKDQMRLSVISDHVNVAKRLQVKCRELNASVLFGEDVLKGVQLDSINIPMKFVGELDLKGKAKKVGVYELLTRASQREAAPSTGTGSTRRGGETL